MFPVSRATTPREEKMKTVEKRLIKKFVEVDNIPGVVEKKIKDLHLAGYKNIKKKKPSYGNVRITYSKPI